MSSSDSTGSVSYIANCWIPGSTTTPWFGTPNPWTNVKTSSVFKVTGAVKIKVKVWES
jgi:hypothetical protein